MAKFRITGPGGETYEITAPDGASEEDVMSFARQQSFGAPQQQLPTVQQVNIPSQRNPVGMAEGLIGSAFQGVTFGAGDEIAAGLKAAVNPFNASEVYNDQLERTRSRNEQFREQSPVASTAAEIGGALPTAFIPLGALGRAAQGGSAATRALAGGAIGAGQGATYAFNAGEGGFEDRASDAVTGAALGGALGAAAPAIGGVARRGAQALANRGATRATIANAPTTQELRASAAKLFDSASKDGVSVTPAAFRSAVDDIAQYAANEGLDPTLHPGATAALKRLTQAVDDPNQTASVETLRRVLGSAARSSAPDEGRIASGMIDRLDDFMDNLTPDQISGGDPASIATLKQARELWGRMRRSEMVDEALELAGDSAGSVGVGGNINNAARQKLRAILASPTKRRGFSEQELAALREVVRGTPTQNALRLLGALAPQRGGLPLVMNVGAAGTTGMATVPLSSAAAGAKMLADRGTQNSTRFAQALIASGGNLPPAQISPQSGRLAELLAQRNAAITGPVSR